MNNYHKIPPSGNQVGAAFLAKSAQTKRNKTKAILGDKERDVTVEASKTPKVKTHNAIPGVLRKGIVKGLKIKVGLHRKLLKKQAKRRREGQLHTLKSRFNDFTKILQYPEVAQIVKLKNEKGEEVLAIMHNGAAHSKCQGLKNMPLGTVYGLEMVLGEMDEDQKSNHSSNFIPELHRGGVTYSLLILNEDILGLTRESKSDLGHALNILEKTRPPLPMGIHESVELLQKNQGARIKASQAFQKFDKNIDLSDINKAKQELASLGKNLQKVYKDCNLDYQEKIKSKIKDYYDGFYKSVHLSKNEAFDLQWMMLNDTDLSELADWKTALKADDVNHLFVNIFSDLSILKEDDKIHSQSKFTAIAEAGNKLKTLSEKLDLKGSSSASELSQKTYFADLIVQHLKNLKFHELDATYKDSFKNTPAWVDLGVGFALLENIKLP